jgi:hypothetical protein
MNFVSANEMMTSAYRTRDAGRLRICEVDATMAAGVRSRWRGGRKGTDTWSIISECERINRLADRS